MRAPESDRRRAGQDGAHHRARQGEPGPRSARCAATPAAARPNRRWVVDFTYVPTRSGFCCTAFVTGPVLPPHRRLGHRQPHGAPTTRPAPPGRRSGGASTATAATSRARHHHGGQCLSIAHAGRLVDEGTGRIGRSRGLLLRRRRRRGPGQVLQARGPFWRDGPWKDRDDPRDRHRPVGEPVPTAPDPTAPTPTTSHPPPPNTATIATTPPPPPPRPPRHNQPSTKPRTIQTPREFATTLEDTTPGRRGVSL